MLEGRRTRLSSAKHTSSVNSTGKSKTSLLEDSSLLSPNDSGTMTRKPIRTRRPRIPILQSGYCAICSLPYNSIEDHIQSKKHLKLIGEDANYIALNGYIHSDVGIQSLLSLTGIEAIGYEDFTSPRIRRRTMSKTKSSSIMSDVVKPVEVVENESKHRLRSRKNINYMTPPLEEDSFQDKPDLEPVRFEYKEYRELRSSTRALAKLTSLTTDKELWDSGRPKRSCINRSKRVSADERLVSDNKTYYKVEVLSNKLRSNEKDKESTKQQQSKTNDTDKGLIVKFKKLRNSELVQLNNEATNFLFPKKDESSEDEEEGHEDETNETEDEVKTESEPTEITSSSELEEVKPPDKFKVEEECSLDSISSECRKRRKRRSHAEAFIMDNQKYYKFETPGSSSYRLRYHGSYLSPVPTKSNGEVTVKIEKDLEEKKDAIDRLKINANDYTFSFETVPENEKWYKTFQRQDRSEERYPFSRNYFWNDFVLPCKISHLKPLDPRMCFSAYKAILNGVLDSHTEKLSEEPVTEDVAESVEMSDSVLEEKEEEEDPEVEQMDEDSKLSDLSTVSTNVEEQPPEEAETRRVGRRRKCLTLSPTTSGGRNPRKSPRQHASTLAILSLIHQRKRRLRTGATGNSSPALQTIPEEPTPAPPVAHRKSPPQKPRKKKIDLVANAIRMEEEFDALLDEDVDLNLEPTTDPDYASFKDSRLNVDDIMTLFEQSKIRENEKIVKKMYNGPTGRKPSKRKKNKTGWPKVKKRKVLKGENESVAGDLNNADTDDEDGEEHDDCDSITEGDGNHNHKTGDVDDFDSDRVVDNSELRDNSTMQPFVFVKKLASSGTSVNKKQAVPLKRTVRPMRRKQRRVMTSPKSPRILRKPRGRWYRER